NHRRGRKAADPRQGRPAAALVHVVWQDPAPGPHQGSARPHDRLAHPGEILRRPPQGHTQTARRAPPWPRCRPAAPPPASPPDRRPAPVTVLTREHGGVRHTVTPSPGGFVWQERTYPSLSAIARAITGTSWNGRRFFGLRMKRKADRAEAGQ